MLFSAELCAWHLAGLQEEGLPSQPRPLKLVQTGDCKVDSSGHWGGLDQARQEEPDMLAVGQTR